MVRVLLLTACATVAAAQFNIKHTQYGTSPPVYPSPRTCGAGGWDAALEKAQTFVADLTTEEKAQIITGTSGPCVGNIAPIPRLNFSGLCLQDGPLAVRQADSVSVFSAGISAAASWDRALVRQRGEYMGAEFRGKGAHVALGPVVGALGRSPFGGRNWEGFSPDAYLSGVLVEETIYGIQSAGVQACTKHFIANEQEIQRNPSVVNGVTIEAVSSNVDDKTMHETYLWPFANAVRAGTSAVMCSYQRINGSYACQNSKALNGLLKGELGFQGYTMSDWLATHSGVAPANAGLDMNMPGGIIFPNPTPSFWGDNITIAVNNGSLSGERLDDMVRRIMTPYFQLGQDVGFPPIDGHTPDLGFFGASGYAHDFMLGPNVDVRSQHHTKLIRDLGAAGTVLLKNINGALPLRVPKTIGVFGNDAADLTRGQYSLATTGPNLMDGDYDIGTLAVGGGSGTGRFPYVVSPLEAIKTRGQSQGAIVQYVTDNEYIVGGGLASLGSLPPEVCIVFLKSWASEGDDRTTLTAEWNSTAVVDRTAAICNNTVVVLHGAAPNTMPWRNNPNVTAILVAHMPGQESGNAVADVLWGDVNPSGRLPYTIADNEADYARNLINSTELATTTDPDAWQADFIEGNLIDYKAFDAHNKSVAFEFGFGLSYTPFDVSCLQIEVGAGNVSRMPDPTAPIQPGGNAELWDTLATIRATVTNTGSVAGATVPQLYLSYPPEANAPARSLRGFEKMRLDARASGTVQFSLTRRDLSYWETTAQAWTLPAGRIGVQVGFSSRKLPLEGGFTVPLLAPTG